MAASRKGSGIWVSVPRAVNSDTANVRQAVADSMPCARLDACNTARTSKANVVRDVARLSRYIIVRFARTKLPND